MSAAVSFKELRSIKVMNLQKSLLDSLSKSLLHLFGFVDFCKIHFKFNFFVNFCHLQLKELE